MLSVYRTLSTRHLSKRWFRAGLIVASIALGVATLVATRALSETMAKAGLQASNPMAGAADLLVGGGGNDKLIDISLVRELEQIKGVRSAHPRIFTKVKLPQLGNRKALLIGIDLQREIASSQTEFWTVSLDPHFLGKLDFNAIFKDLSSVFWEGRVPVIIGRDLVDDLSEAARSKKSKTGKSTDSKAKDPEQDAKTLNVVPVQNPENEFALTRIGTVDAHGPAAALGGNILIVEINAANFLLGMEGKANRIDLAIDPKMDRDIVRKQVDEVLEGRAIVTTPEEQNQMVMSVFSGMQTGFSLSGIAALVVGLFLVYNALAVSVAERRHEIGVIMSLGGTRAQVRMLFAGEAAFLGVLGSLLGIPLGIGLAYIGLQPVQEVLRDVFMELEANQVDVSPSVIVMAIIAGTVTAVMAALVPAISASGEKPAEAVRRIPPKTSWAYCVWQIGISIALMITGVILIVVRHQLPSQVGTFGGMVTVMLGALIATPLIAAVIAKLLQPLVRATMGIEGRLASDNLVRSPARTGLVIAALAAGVSLVMQIAGTIKSNREALRDWVKESITADLFVTSGSPVGAAGQNEPMPASLKTELETIPGVDTALPIRSGKHIYDKKQVMILAFAAGDLYRAESKQGHSNELYKRLGEETNAMIVSENFRALHKLGKGDSITLTTPNGPVRFHIIGEIPEYSWNHGSLIVNRKDYVRHWRDDKVDIFDVFLTTGADAEAGRKSILRNVGAEYSLFIQTRSELQAHIDSMIERLYGIAYGQLIVVMFVAALGVVTALLISVLQRRREMGLLRAIGASQAQVVRSVLAEAALMGIIGTFIGVIVGIPMEWYVLQVVLLEESGYFFAVYIPWTEALIVAGCAIFLATLAGLGPAIFAVRQRIPEAIAYE